jgi:hypothetical protein
MPAQSPLLPSILGRHERSSYAGLPLTWPDPVRLGTPPDLQIALGAVLLFEHASAVMEGLSVWGEDIQPLIYGWPWVQGQHLGRPRFPPSKSAQSMILALSAKSTQGQAGS